jgi:hypothetical protein
VTQEKANSIIIPAEADADDDMRELHNDVAIFSSYINAVNMLRIIFNQSEVTCGK